MVGRGQKNVVNFILKELTKIKISAALTMNRCESKWTSALREDSDGRRREGGQSFGSKFGLSFFIEAILDTRLVRSFTLSCTEPRAFFLQRQLSCQDR